MARPEHKRWLSGLRRGDTVIVVDRWATGLDGLVRLVVTSATTEYLYCGPEGPGFTRWFYRRSGNEVHSRQFYIRPPLKGKA